MQQRRYNPERHAENVRNALVYWGKDGKNRVPRYKNFAGILQVGQVPTTVWLHQEVGNNQEARKESLQFNEADPFATPKPERLIKRILDVASSEGDLVLDSFAGSGTTGAVAHKMGRRWIMVELGEHCDTHIRPRLEKVINGDDKGGVSEATGWKGGGGYRYYTLAPSLLERDRWGRLVISEAYRANGKPELLVQALCKLEGFTYEPSETIYWQQARSTESDYLYVTTQTLTHEQLHQLSEEVGADRSLLVLCAAFHGRADEWPNLTVRKIPQHIQDRCDWGHDDYSLKVENLPQAPETVAVTKTGQGRMDI